MVNGGKEGQPISENQWKILNQPLSSVRMSALKF